MAKKSLTAAVSQEIKGAFSLDKFKEKKLLSSNVKFKPQRWIPLSKAFQDQTSIPGIPQGHIVLLRGHSDTGKAQPLHSKVLTPQGWELMGNITVGSRVIGSDGKPKTVLGVYPQGVLDSYRVSFSDGTSVECCGDHLWEVESYRDRSSNHGRAKRLATQSRDQEYYRQKRVITTREIQETLYVAPSPGKAPGSQVRNYKVPVVKPVEFEQEWELPIKPYTVGALIGDGTLKDACNITTTDSFILKRISEELPEHMELTVPYGEITYGLITRDLKKGNTYRRALKELGLNVNSQDKFIPNIYKYSSIESRTALLHGLMDTDGYVSADGTNTEYSTVSKQLAEDVAELVRSLGHVAKVSFRENSHKGCYKVYITDNGVDAVVSLPRKLSRLRLKSKYTAAKYITSVEYIGPQEQQCIYIDSEDHLYVTDGTTLTHNTTALLEAAVSAQKAGVLPVFIITEMKWNWEHAMQMGLQVEEEVDESTGEVVNYKGNFIYVDRETLQSIEDVAGFILDLLDEQKKGNLPYDLLFLWDSIGSVPCELSIKSNKNNNEWNAGAMSTQFGNGVNQRIVMSRKESSPYTNTLVCINKVWTQKPESPMGQPKLMNKGGFAMWYDATFVMTFGNITNAGTSKIKAVKGGQQVEFAKRTNIQIDKNHINGITTRGRLIMTPHGFIADDENALKKYKDAHTDEWSRLLGGADFNVVEEKEEPEGTNYFENEP